MQVSDEDAQGGELLEQMLGGWGCLGTTAWGMQFETRLGSGAERSHFIQALKTRLGGWLLWRRTGEPLKVLERGRNRISSVLIPSFFH